MDQTPRAIYFCPKHADVGRSGPGKCPKCGMDLLPAGTRFALLRHMAGNPLNLVGVLLLMIALMAAAMMVMIG